MQNVSAPGQKAVGGQRPDGCRLCISALLSAAGQRRWQGAAGQLSGLEPLLRGDGEAGLPARSKSSLCGPLRVRSPLQRESPHPRLGLRSPAGKELSSLPLLFLKAPPLPQAEREFSTTGSLLERPQRAESRLKPGAWDTTSVSCVGGKSHQHCPRGSS